MTSPPNNSPDGLCAEILAEARRESDEILRRAGETADQLHASALAEAEQIRRENLALALAEASRRQGMILATIAVEVARLRAARIETLLESVHTEIRQQLATAADNRLETVVALAVEAIQQMSGGDFILRVAPADFPVFGDRLAAEILRQSGCAALHLVVIADAAVTGGIVVQSATGGQLWDNQMSSRLQRFWPELRQQIATHAGLADQNVPAGGDV